MKHIPTQHLRVALRLARHNMRNVKHSPLSVQRAAAITRELLARGEYLQLALGE